MKEPDNTPDAKYCIRFEGNRIVVDKLDSVTWKEVFEMAARDIEMYEAGVKAYQLERFRDNPFREE